MTFDCIVIARSVSDAAIQVHGTDHSHRAACHIILIAQALDCRAALAMTMLDYSNVIMLLTPAYAEDYKPGDRDLGLTPQKSPK
jgi:hypothetical protein